MKLIKIVLMFGVVFFCSMSNAISMTAEKATISIMTFNIENGGAQVDFSKTVQAIKKANADVVGIQEAWGNTKRIADELGWKYYDPRQHVVSKFPLLDAPTSAGKYVFVEVVPGKVVAIANTHLPDHPYGPDLARDGATAKAVEENERKVRLSTMLPVMKAMQVLAKRHVPVFITGDFNSASHLDWVAGTRYRYVVEWPVTKLLLTNGFRDSFRVMYPDPVKVPGITWPAGRPFVENTPDNFNPSEKDPLDRIDFIFFANATVLASEVIGEPGVEGVEITVSPWPSDHRAVVSRFNVTPVVSPKNLQPVANRLTGAGKTPAVILPKSSVKQGTPFTIKWKNAPGNGYDYLAIVPATTNVNYETARLYTRGDINGSVQFNAANGSGNWTEWNKGNNDWPLKPGVYDVKLMADDSFTVLASAKLTVSR